MQHFTKSARKLCVITGIVASSFVSTPDANAGINSFTPQGNVTHVKRLDFKRFGDKSFGYAEVFKDQTGKVYLQILYSNGTHTQYRYSAVIECLVNGAVESRQIYSEKVGWSLHGSVERAAKYAIDCSSDAKLAFRWDRRKLDVVSVDDLITIASTAARTWVSDFTVSQIFGEETVGNIFK